MIFLNYISLSNNLSHWPPKILQIDICWSTVAQILTPYRQSEWLWMHQIYLFHTMIQTPRAHNATVTLLQCCIQYCCSVHICNRSCPPYYNIAAMFLQCCCNLSATSLQCFRNVQAALLHRSLNTHIIKNKKISKHTRATHLFNSNVRNIFYNYSNYNAITNR